MAVYQPKKVTAMPGSPTANTVYFVKNVGDSRIQMYVTDTSGTAFPVGILTENDVLGASLAGFSTGSDIALSSSDTIIQAFQKVQGQINALSTSVSQGMKVPLPLDCSTEPNYPAAEAGDSYKVTVAGKIGGASGPIVQVGDVITALTDNGGGSEAAVGTQWFILQANTDNATESVTGLTRIATQAEVNTGSEAFAYVTPLTLDGKLGDFVPEARTLTINGVTEDLSTDRNLGNFVSLNASSASVTQVANIDLSAVLSSYFGISNSYVNAPISQGTVISNLSNAGSGFQLFAAHQAVGSDNIYARTSLSGSFNSWIRLASREWVTANYQDAGNYVKADPAATDYSIVNTGVDLNTKKYTQFGVAASGSNMPNGLTTGFYISNFAPSDSGFQIFGHQNSEDHFYYRKTQAGAFGSWFRVASREWVTTNFQSALTNPVTGTGSNGQVSFWDGTNTQAGSNNLTWEGSVNTYGKLLSGSQIVLKRLIDGGQNFSISAVDNRNFEIRNSSIQASWIKLTESGYTAIGKSASDELWRFELDGNLRSIGAASIATATGNLTLSTRAGNGNIIFSPNGAGIVRTDRPLALGSSSPAGSPQHLSIGANDTYRFFSYNRSIGGTTGFSFGAYFDGTNWKQDGNGNSYLRRGGAFTFVQNGGSFRWAVTDNVYVIGAGAGDTQTLSDIMTLSYGGNLVTIGSLTGTSFVKTGGTASQFLKANGSVDSTIYQPSRSITSPTGSIAIIGGVAGSTSTELEMQWGAADW